MNLFTGIPFVYLVCHVWLTSASNYNEMSTEDLKDLSDCGSETNGTKCVIKLTPTPGQSNKYTFTTNATHKYFAFNVFNLHENDAVTLYYGDNRTASSITGNFSGKSDPFLAVTFSPVAVLVFKSSDDSYDRSLTVEYNTKGCELFINQSSGSIKSPVYTPSSSATINCTYHISSPGKDGGHVALSFDQANLTKGSVRGWDDKTRTGNMVVNYTAGVKDASLSDMVSTRQDLLIEADLAASRPENFTASFITENKACLGGVINLEKPLILTTPGFPGNYGNNLDCRLVVSAPQGYTINLELLTLDLADDIDNVVLNDGDSKTSASLLTMNKGFNQSGVVMSSSNKLLLRFRTDESGTSKGASLKLTPQEYGGMFRNSGQIVLKKHPRNDTTYNLDNVPNVTIPSPPIYFLLRAPKGLQVRVELEKAFLMPTSTIDFRDGDNVNASLLGHFRSDHPSYPVVSRGNTMLVVVNGFYSNGSMTQQKFIANFTSIKPGSQFSMSGDGSSATLRAAQINQTVTYIIVNPNNENLVSLHIERLHLPNNASIAIYRGASSQFIRVINITGSMGPQASKLPVLYVPEARIVYKLNPTENATVSGDTVLLSFSYQIIPACGGPDIAKYSGSITSPSYPNLYPANALCAWTFIPRQNTLLRLNFKNLMLKGNHSLTIEADHYHILPNKTVPVISTTETLRQLRGSLDDVPDMIISMNNNSLNSTKVKVIFNSTFSGNQGDLDVGQGFRLDYQHLACGGNLTNSSTGLSTPGYPKPVDMDNITCVWVINIPKTNNGTANSSVNIVSYKYIIQHYAKDTNTSRSRFEARDGGSERDPLILLSLKDGKSGTLLSRSNQLWLSYTFNRTQGGKSKGFALSLSYSSSACSSLCDNGVCMHSDWKCNGKDECGDDSDERDCFHATNMVTRLGLGMAVVVTFIIATALACVVPAVYKRMKYSNYSELRDLMTPVPT